MAIHRQAAILSSAEGSATRLGKQPAPPRCGLFLLWIKGAAAAAFLWVLKVNIACLPAIYEHYDSCLCSSLLRFHGFRFQRL